MKKTLLTILTLLGSAWVVSAQQVDPALAAALQTALNNQQQYQSYGDAWAARHGTQYNPWTSYYQWKAERQQSRSQRDLEALLYLMGNQ
jgi:hypothetical protein